MVQPCLGKMELDKDISSPFPLAARTATWLSGPNVIRAIQKPVPVQTPPPEPITIKDTEAETDLLLRIVVAFSPFGQLVLGRRRSKARGAGVIGTAAREREAAPPRRDAAGQGRVVVPGMTGRRWSQRSGLIQSSFKRTTRESTENIGEKRAMTWSLTVQTESDGTTYWESMSSRAMSEKQDA